MTAPRHTDPIESWSTWLEQVAPYGGPTEAEQPIEIRELARIADREIATLAARGIVATLRNAGRRV